MKKLEADVEPKETHLKLWEYCMRDWDKGGLGMKDILEYIGVKIE